MSFVGLGGGEIRLETKKTGRIAPCRIWSYATEAGLLSSNYYKALPRSTNGEGLSRYLLILKAKAKILHWTFGN